MCIVHKLSKNHHRRKRIRSVFTQHYSLGLNAMESNGADDLITESIHEERIFLMGVSSVNSKLLCVDVFCVIHKHLYSMSYN